MSTQMTTVPDGHTVVVFQVAPHPVLARTESGVWIADTGPGPLSEEFIPEVADTIAADPESNVVIVVQPSALARELEYSPAMTARMRQLFTLCERTTVDMPVVVVPQGVPGSLELTRLIQSIGLRVHDVARDEAVFVEVHQPEGIRTFFPGPPLQASEGPILSAIFWSGLRSASEGGVPPEVAEQRARAFVMQQLARLRSPAELAQMDLPALVTLLADDHRDEHMAAFCKALLYSEVGGRAATPGEQHRLETSTLDDGTPMLVCLCAPKELAEAFPGQQFFGMSGREMLEMAAAKGFGLIVSNRIPGREAWIGLRPAQVTQILAAAEPDEPASPVGTGAQPAQRGGQEQARYLIPGHDRVLREPTPAVIARRLAPLLLLGLIFAGLASLFLSPTFGVSPEAALVFQLMRLAGFGAALWAIVRAARDVVTLRAYRMARARTHEGRG